MILDEMEVKERYESPLNLLNRLKIGVKSKSEILSLPPTASDVIQDLDDKLKMAGLKSKAATIMNLCLDELTANVDVIRPEKLATVAAEMNKIINAETDRDKENGAQAPTFHVYAPTFVDEKHFETVYVKE